MKLSSRSIKHIGESLLRDEYDGLAEFFRKIWSMPHAYVVVFARRCMNLNEVFMHVYADDPDVTIYRKQIISNNALLLYSDEIADYYNTWGQFPSILIADDMIYHGRGIVKLLHDLEELVAARLEELRGEKLSKDARYYVHRDLAAMIDIYAYCVNQQPLLIDDAYLRQLDSKSTRYTSELRNLSQQISRFLQSVGEPNTSYVLSIDKRLGAELQAEGWFKQPWSYRGNKQEMFLCTSDLHYVSSGFLPSVRIHRKYGYPECPEIKMTALVIFGNMTTEKINDICEDVIQVLQQNGLEKLKTVFRILRSENILHQKARMQFLSFLLSVMCLRHFYHDTGLPEEELNVELTDLDKIARNFARRKDIYDELVELYGHPTVWQDLEEPFYKAFSESAEPFLSRSPKCWETHRDDLMDKTNFEVQSLIYEIGMDSDKSAWLTVNRFERFHLETPAKDLIPLNRYMDEISHKGRGAAEIPEASAVSSMLAQMDNGPMSMNVETDPVCPEGDPPKVHCVLKAGELSTFVMPRYYHQFIPALALVERNHWMLAVDRGEAVKRFIQELPEEFPVQEEPAEEVGKTLEEEAAAFRHLKQNGAAFVSRLYECGQSLNGWDIDLVTVDDWRGEVSYLSFATFEKKRQQIYRDLAKAFLSKYKTQN